jgi:hypothetical protein
MNKTPALGAGVSVHCGGEPIPLSNSRPVLKASDRAKARLRMHLRFFPWLMSKRRRVAQW